MIRSINGTAMKFPINSICDNCLMIRSINGTAMKFI